MNLFFQWYVQSFFDVRYNFGLLDTAISTMICWITKISTIYRITVIFLLITNLLCFCCCCCASPQAEVRAGQAYYVCNGELYQKKLEDDFNVSIVVWMDRKIVHLE